MKLRHIKFFGVRYVVNLLIDWVNEHEIQSQKTLAFRGEAEKDIKRLYGRTDVNEARFLDHEHEIRSLTDRIERLEPKDQPEDPNIFGHG